MAESAFMTGTQQDHVLAIVGLNPFFDGRKALAHDFPVNGGILLLAHLGKIPSHSIWPIWLLSSSSQRSSAPRIHGLMYW